MSETETTDSGESTSRVGHAWVDYFSWGHVAMGIGVYSVTWFIIGLIGTVFQSALSFIITMLLACWLWEVFENNLMWSWGMKFENRQDSINNLLGDQMWVFIGSVIMFVVELIVVGSYPEYWFFIIAGIGLAICLIGFLISKAYHEKHNT